MHCYLIATDIGIGYARIVMLIYLKMLKNTAVLAETEVILEIAKIDINFQLKNCRAVVGDDCRWQSSIADRDESRDGNG